MLSLLLKKSCNLTRRQLLSLAGVLGLSALVPGCSKNPEENQDQDDVATEMARIEQTYRAWSAKLIAQDYLGALALCVPGSNGVGATNVHHSDWVSGGQSYHDITYVEAWLDEDDLRRNYGEAIGNATYVQHTSQGGSVAHKIGFYSSARRIDGQWKIDGINSNLEPNWWEA